MVEIYSPSIQYMDDEEKVRLCYPLMSKLRPHLATDEEFVSRWRRQEKEGYRLLGLTEGDQVYALAGYRLQENLVYGRFLYVDDLITDDKLRGLGFGEYLMDYLKRVAHEMRCERLILDTPLSNALGHRFYFRNGLLATALRFGLETTEETVESRCE